MSNLDFEIILDAKKSDLEQIFVDYEYYPNYLKQIESVEIMEDNEGEIITKQILVFSTYLKNKIVQTTSHKVHNGKFFSKILDGPAKGTEVVIEFLQENEKTKVNVQADLTLSLKAKIFLPIIKKAYKRFLTGIFYKMNSRAIQR